jgi:nucleotide-binding universal stress UspA family protein
MIEIRQILCPVDFSAPSERALAYAAATAKWYDARLDVLHVHWEVPAVNPIPSLTPDPAAQLSQRDLGHAQIFEMATRLVQPVQDADVPVHLEVRDERAIHRGILDYARERNVDLIVMGTHGRSGVERWLLGSTADKVIRKAACPVLIVPAAADQAAPAGDVEFDSILCPVDFSAGSLVALEYALSMAEEADAHLTLLHVIEVPPELQAHDGMEEPNVDRIRAAAEARQLRRLRELIPDAAREYCHVHTAVAEGSAYREILRYAGETRSDLIVMGVQGRGAIDEFVFGSNTAQVIRAAAHPVLTVPPGVNG